jgi:hypothetical protein
LIDAVLPSGKIVTLIFDTGYDSLADALLYESEVGDLSFVQTGESEIKDAHGSHRTRFGTVQSLKIGEVSLAPALVQLSDQTSAEQPILKYGGMIGLFPFRNSIIALDFPRLRLFFSVRTSTHQPDKRR